MNALLFPRSAVLLFLSIILSAGMFLQACTSTADLTEVNHTVLPTEESEAFRAAMQALDNVGFNMSRMDAKNGHIEAVFVNRGSQNDGGFFGYTSNTAQRVKADIKLLENGRQTRLNLDLYEVYAASSSQYGSFDTEDSEHLLRKTKYYENLIGAIREQLGLNQADSVSGEEGQPEETASED
ncbi:MAG: hypothetical protein ACOC2C_00370 [Cyclonatronaceae bacterium]